MSCPAWRSHHSEADVRHARKHVRSQPAEGVNRRRPRSSRGSSASRLPSAGVAFARDQAFNSLMNDCSVLVTPVRQEVHRRWTNHVKGADCSIIGSAIVIWITIKHPPAVSSADLASRPLLGAGEHAVLDTKCTVLIASTEFCACRRQISLTAVPTASSAANREMFDQH